VISWFQAFAFKWVNLRRYAWDRLLFRHRVLERDERTVRVGYKNTFHFTLF
jgi:hypothetical protein